MLLYFFPSLRRTVFTALLLALAGRVLAQNGPISPNDSVRSLSPAGWSFHLQQTVIRQWHSSFAAPYTGPYSLRPRESAKTSLTTTAFIGRRLWRGAEAYLDPEIAGGSGLSGARGIAGFTNGETFRIGDPSPVLYLARLYVRQVVALGPVHTEHLNDGFNQLEADRPTRYLAFTIGKFSIADFFDQNPYSHDPRTQFWNWSLMSAGAWDYPANTRGYTAGAVIEYVAPAFAVRYGLTAVPTAANGPLLHPLDRYHHSSVLEVSATAGAAGSHPLTVRALGFLTYAPMGDYRQAIAEAAALPPPDFPPYSRTPDVTATRRTGRTKYGAALNASYQASARFGLFARASWNDGHHETWAFTEIDQSAHCGAVWRPRRRTHDALGVAAVVNGISSAHRQYLAAGGYGFIVGDGALRYAPETIGEVYYAFFLPGHLNATLSPDYQLVVNPGYNHARQGPIHVVGLRFHLEV